jgi:DNA-binding beta-propeller fold protein YncE
VPSSIGGEGSIGAGAGSIWLVTDGETCAACTLARVDAASLAVIAKVPLDAGSAGVRFGLGAVWVTNPENGTVTKVDPSSNAVVAKTSVTGAPRFFAVGQGGVWTLNQADGSVTRIDPSTGAARTRIRAGVIGEGGDMTTGAGWVWARGSGYLLSRIDPKSNRVVERYGPSLGSGAVIVGYSAVWISAHDDGSIFRLPLSKI